MIRRILDWFRMEIIAENDPAAKPKIAAGAAVALIVLIFFQSLI